MAHFVLGANAFGRTADRETSFAVLDAFVASGGRRIDTADSGTWHEPDGSDGGPEAVLGEWMAARGNRDALHVATQVGPRPGRDGPAGTAIARAARESLARLRTDRIDLYYAPRDDQDTAQEETLDAFDALVREGLVREIGASDFSAHQLRSALEISERDGLTAFSAIRSHYNLMERDDVEASLVPLAESLKLDLYPHSGLAKGFLAGGYRPDSPVPEGPRAAAAASYLDSRGRAVLAGLDEIAAGHGVPVPSVALAWLAAQPSVTAPVVGARTVEQLAGLLAMRTLELTHDELRLLSYLSATG